MLTPDFTVINNLIIGVTTVAFSKNQELVNILKNVGFKKVLINEKGLRLSKEELITFLSNCDIAIIGLDKINENILKKVKNLKAISKYGVGLDNIDFDACEKYNIDVLHTQGVNKRSVSEMTLGFMLSLCRNLYISSNLLKKGIWEKNGGIQLTNKTIGIIGVGNVGKDLISLLKPFNCKILVNDILNQDKYYKENDLVYTSKDDIFKSCDIITIHTPLNKETKYILNEISFLKMKKTAFVINTARGGIINQEDLKNALKNNIIAGAALDPYEIEPPIDKELLELPNLINTPHIGGNSKEAVQAMGLASIDNTIKYMKEKHGNNR